MAALQIISGILHATLGVQAPYRAAMIVSMVPLTPVVLFSIPLAIWYWKDYVGRQFTDRQSGHTIVEELGSNDDDVLARESQG